jgi:hypothetical protein
MNKLTAYKLKKLLKAGYRVYDHTEIPGFYDFEYFLIKDKLHYRQKNEFGSPTWVTSYKKALEELNAGYIIDGTNLMANQLDDLINK